MEKSEIKIAPWLKGHKKINTNLDDYEIGYDDGRKKGFEEGYNTATDNQSIIWMTIFMAAAIVAFVEFVRYSAIWFNK